MNRKNDIIEAWIIVEQLSEGNINTKDSIYKIVEPEEVPKIESDETRAESESFDWKLYFLNNLRDFIEREKIKEKNLSSVGLTLYFGIFNFSKVVEIFREKYGLVSTDEDIKNTDKFSLALSFDKDLNFISDKLFLTMSGWIKENKDIPPNLMGVENTLKVQLNQLFTEKGFNEAFEQLNKKYSIDKYNFRVAFIKNIETSTVDMHSFFIDDLRKAIHIETENIERYFDGFTGERVDLDGNTASPTFHPKIFDEILQPKYYPMGRFPSNPDFALSFMQQVAVNLYLYDSSNMLSVNGPPGTGKTTLLKDIFADLTVRQSYSMIQNMDKALERTYKYYREAKIAKLPKEISQYNIIVASSNNGAVQNIVKELPLIKDIDECFVEQLNKTNYFKQSSNAESKKIYNEETKKYEIQMKELEEKNWGAFSVEGGSSANINKLLNYIDLICEELSEWEPREGIIKEFEEWYDKVHTRKEKLQSICSQIQGLSDIKRRMEQATSNLNMRQNKEADRITQESVIEEKIRLLEEKSATLKEQVSGAIERQNLSQQDLERAKRNFDVVLMQRPDKSLLDRIKGIFIKADHSEYHIKLEEANRVLNQCETENKEIRARISTMGKQLQDMDSDRNNLINQKSAQQKAFSQWIEKEEKIIKDCKDRLNKSKEMINKEKINPIDFTLEYNALQKSNPWFDKDFRIMQSKLFIAALEVRKLFLYENRKNLKAAKIIFQQQKDYVTKEEGTVLIKAAWEWINLAIPIVSSTFASFGSMFRYFGQDSLGAVFIDEAGQATPQASVGSIFRSKKIMVVGDPSQIKPVLTLDANMMNLIAEKYKVDETFISNDVSTQSLVDRASRYGFVKSEQEWIGIPLWVHRRSKDPMFTIANRISYNDLMVQGKMPEDSRGKSFWYDVKGAAKDKYVTKQGEKLRELIENKLRENPSLKDHIYVITPFRNVAYNLIRELRKIDFVHFDKNKKATNVGTVHTFQGKEAKIVYFVLGADSNSKGAAKWAVSQPNIINVAATRAKEEFYIIGDRDLYFGLGSKIANQTIDIIDEYNAKC